MTTVLDSFEQWKSFLSDRVAQAKASGMSEGFIATLAKQIGEFLSDKVDPKNGEQRLLKEMWDISSDEERHTLSHILVKYAEKMA
jgi:nuclear transport factor 2 (NTF2) superfamily protein